MYNVGGRVKRYAVNLASLVGAGTKKNIKRGNSKSYIILTADTEKELNPNPPGDAVRHQK